MRESYMTQSMMTYGHIVPLWVQCFEIHNKMWNSQRNTHQGFRTNYSCHLSLGPLPASTSAISNRTIFNITYSIPYTNTHENDVDWNNMTLQMDSVVKCNSSIDILAVNGITLRRTQTHTHIKNKWPLMRKMLPFDDVIVNSSAAMTLDANGILVLDFLCSIHGTIPIRVNLSQKQTI